MNEDELIDIISDVTALLGAALAQYIELNESIAGAGVESQTLKLDALKARMADEKLKVAKLTDAAKRRTVPGTRPTRASHPLAVSNCSAVRAVSLDGCTTKRTAR